MPKFWEVKVQVHADDAASALKGVTNALTAQDVIHKVTLDGIRPIAGPWRPLDSSSPKKDGTRVIGYYDVTDIAETMVWSNDRKAWTTPEEIPVVATHWMPQPKPSND